MKDLQDGRIEYRFGNYERDKGTKSWRWGQYATFFVREPDKRTYTKDEGNVAINWFNISSVRNTLSWPSRSGNSDSPEQFFSTYEGDVDDEELRICPSN